MRMTLNRTVGPHRPLARHASGGARIALAATLALASLPLAHGLHAQSPGPIPADARIVTLGGSVTEIVFALGFGDRVVAVDGSSLFPASVTELPQVGYYRTLAAEGLLSLRPDVILGAAASGPPPVLEMMRAAGVRVELIDDAYTPDQIPENIERIAAVLGVPERGAALASAVRDDFEQVARIRGEAGTDLSAAFVWNRDGPGLQVAGRETAVHTMLGVAGIRNAADGIVGYQPFNAEAMLLADPDLLIVPAETAEGLGGLEALLRAPGVASTTAARRGNVVLVDLLAFVGFGPRSGDQLVRVLEETQRPAPAPTPRDGRLAHR